MTHRLRIACTGDGPYYAPPAAAARLGWFEEEGLQVEIQDHGYGTGALDAVLGGDAAVGMGGWWRPMILTISGQPLKAFALVNQRNATFLLSRSPEFGWSDLEERSVILFDSAPSPWVALHEVLRREHVRVDRIRLLPGFSVPEAVGMFRRGCGDFIELAEPEADALVQDGTAYVVASLGEWSGPVPWTVYYATPEVLERQHDGLAALTRAIARAQRWLGEEPTDHVAGVLGPAFPHLGPASLSRIVERYRRQGTWPDSPVLERTMFERWRDLLCSSSLISRRVDFDEVGTDDVAALAAVPVVPPARVAGT